MKTKLQALVSFIKSDFFTEVMGFTNT